MNIYLHAIDVLPGFAMEMVTEIGTSMDISSSNGPIEARLDVAVEHRALCARRPEVDQLDPDIAVWIFQPKK